MDQKEPAANLISFSMDNSKNSERKNDEKIGYILTWPSKSPKTSKIQIVSKIQFP
jgi:hypothetical protein